MTNATVTAAISDLPGRNGKSARYSFCVRQGSVIQRVSLPEAITTVEAAKAEVIRQYPTATFTYTPEA